MSAENRAAKSSSTLFAGAGVLMVLCCAIGPAVIGAVAGSAVGGWTGIVVACIAAASVGLVMHRRSRRRGC